MVFTLKVRDTVVVQAAQGLATRLLGEQSATEVKFLTKFVRASERFESLLKKL